MTVIENQASRWSVASLVEKKAGRRIAACIPARDEGTTIGSVIEIVAGLREAGLVDHVLVVDDGSTDETNPVSRAAGATVVADRALINSPKPIDPAALADTSTALESLV